MNADFSTLLQQAFALHQSGELDQAERLYLQLDSQQPDQPELLQLLGALYLQKGRYQQALALLERSLELNPTQITARLNLANLYLQLGLQDEARTHEKQLLHDAPHDEGVLQLCATLAMQAGEWELARQRWLQLAARDCDPVAIAQNLATCLEKLNQPDSARGILAEAHSRFPEHIDLGLQYGFSLMLAGQYTTLQELHIRLAAIDANNPKLLLQMAQTAERQNNPEVHNELLGRVLAMYPENPLAKSMQINTQTAAGQYGNALLSLHTLCDFLPSTVRAELLFDICMRLHCYQAAAAVLDAEGEYFAGPNAKRAQLLLRTGEAAAAANMFVSLNKPSTQTRFFTSTALFHAGNYDAAWQGYEVRCEATAAIVDPTPFDGVPAWQGQPLAGKNIIVFNEQGAGDTIQFIRYLPELAKAGANVQLSIVHSESVFALLASQGSEAETVHASHFAVSDADYQIPLLSLPRLCNKVSDTLSSHIPYLHVTAAARQKWGPLFAVLPQSQYRVGLVWAGNPAHKNDQNRSIALKQLDSLSTLPGICWINLQVGASRDEGRYTNSHIEFTDIDEDIASYEDTAAIIEQLDLVIAVDTSVAHLAGALGKPIWTLLPFSPDWRWGISGMRTDWYPSMRLFRQHRPGDWSQAISTLRAALTEELLTSGRLNKAQMALMSGDIVTNFEQLTYSDLAATLDYCLTNNLPHIDGNNQFVLQVNRELSLIQSAQPDTATIAQISNYGLDQLWEKHGSLLVDADAQALIAVLAPPELRPYGHYLLAQRAAQANRLIEAIQHIYQIGQFAPKYAPYRILAADCFYHQHEANKACYFAQLAVHYAPLDGEAWRIFLLVLLKFGLAETVGLLLPEVEARISNRFALCNIKANLAFLGGHPKQGRQYSNELIHIPPADIHEQHEAITALARLGRHQEAIRLCESNPFHPAETDPKRNPLRLHMGLLQLLTGDAQQGWRNYEYRLTPSTDSILRSKPQWCGEPLDGKRLLVYGEQGFGDQIYFARCLSELRTIRVDLAISTALQPLLAPYVETCVSLTDLTDGKLDTTIYDYFIPIGSLPGLLGYTPATPARTSGYISADRELCRIWGDALNQFHGLKVGLVWAGNPDYWRNEYRSMALRQFAPLAGIDNVTFISLQKGLPEREILFAPGGLRVMDLAADLSDFAISAAVLANIDLLITVDTSMAHLAGALGTPVWLLLPQDCDWRWGLNTTHCEWYPSMEFFRQRDQGDWLPVIAQVKDRLLQQSLRPVSHQGDAHHAG